MTNNPPQVEPGEGLAEHFPTGLRSKRHVLSATGEVFESPIQCECWCGASFVGYDEQEVRQLWAEHANSAPHSTDETTRHRTEAIVERDGWQPIETAPQDGTRKRKWWRR